MHAFYFTNFRIKHRINDKDTKKYLAFCSNMSKVSLILLPYNNSCLVQFIKLLTWFCPYDDSSLFHTIQCPWNVLASSTFCRVCYHVQYHHLENLTAKLNISLMDDDEWLTFVTLNICDFRTQITLVPIKFCNLENLIVQWSQIFTCTLFLH